MFEREGISPAEPIAAPVARWVKAGPSDYDDIRRMVAACEAADLREIR